MKKALFILAISLALSNVIFAQEIILLEEINPSSDSDVKIPLDKHKPLFFNGNGGDGSTTTYHSVLSTYIQGIVSGGFDIKPSVQGNGGFSKMLARNVGVMRLFNIALGGGKYYTSSKTIYETKDSLLIDPLKMGNNWRDFSWTYELLLPQALQTQGYQIMYAELSKFFPQYSVTLEKRKTLCYALRKIPGKTIALSAGGEQSFAQNPTTLKMRNASLNLFINALDFYYYSTSKIPIVNLVADKTLTDLVINAPLSSPEAINLELTKYGLELVKGEFEIDMIVYRDRNTTK